MHIEKVTENKIRITLNLEDLKENNIDLHTFMSSSIDSQDLFYDMLDKAKKEVGFETKNYKLMIEALAIPERKFCFNYNSLCTRKRAKEKGTGKKENCKAFK